MIDTAVMHIVAITQLGTPLDEEAKALGGDLGTLPYEQRLKLVAGMPAVVLSTPDEGRATALATAIRARGHDVIHCLASDVVATATMVPLRRFRLDADAIVTTTQPPAQLAWSEIAVLVRAGHRTAVEAHNTVKKRQFSLGRTVLSGGLLTSKTTSRTTVSHTNEIEGVLYLFPRTGGVPWILREQHAQFDVLGYAISPSSAQNFNLVVDMLRSRARGAAFDERLVARKGPPSEVDLLAHLIARSIESTSSGPFR
jgi:hypothetical protein